jgi:carboxyl-terminal processing protease
MKKFLLKTFFFFVFCTVLFNGQAFAFSDTSDTSVKFLEAKSIIEQSEKFYPDRNITRGDFVLWAIKNTGYFGEGKVRQVFSDIKNTDLLAPYAFAAWQAGAVEGETFRAGQKISRLEAMEILFAIEGIHSERVFGKEKVWKDGPTDPVANGILKKAVQLGFLEESEGKIFPQNFVSRLEAAQILKKVLTWRTSRDKATTTITIQKTRNFGNFDAVLQEIENNYVYRDKLDKEALSEAAIRGMLEELKDPYSVYFDEKQKKNFLSMFESSGTEDQSIIGIGVQIASDKEGRIVILNVLPQGGASTAGLQPGDIIVSVDGIFLYGKSTEEASAFIQGKENTIVNLEITRGTNTFTVPIVRKKIEVKGIPHISYEVRDGIVWIRLSIFSGEVVQKFQAILSENVTSSTRGIIIDLRNNGGGLLDASVEMLNEFLPKDTSVLRLISSDENTSVRLQTDGKFQNVPIVVFQNEYSASASEIFSGALQDNKRAKIIGRKSFGKGTAQEFVTFSNGSALKLTINEWRTPNGNTVNGVGITPDIELKEDASDEIYFQEAKRAMGR